MYTPTTKIITITEKYYKSLRSIYSPSLSESIKFNRHGWNHLLYDGTGHRRSEAQIRMRLFLFKDVQEAIIKHVGYPEVATKKINISKKDLEVTYYELNSRLKTGKYLKVIIRKFPDGEFHYYSLRRGKKTKNPL